jgi:hypothetical protein
MNEHEKFKELGALANSGALAPHEWAELKGHLQECQDCREVYSQYLVLTSEGMPFLAAHYADQAVKEIRDDRKLLEKIRDRVMAYEGQGAPTTPDYLEGAAERPPFLPMLPTRFLLATTALAACLAVAIASGYYAGSLEVAGARQAQASAEDRFQKLAVETKTSMDGRLGAQTRDLLQLQEEDSRKESELVKLSSEMRTLADHATGLEAALSAANEQLQTTVAQREALNLRLKDADRAKEQVDADLVRLRAEREKTVRLSASLESKIKELSVLNHDQERKLTSDEELLSSDRDIRELMGARNLYIADVFDVDSRSLTRKPFGRVFYTHGKSLIVYAFDLENQGGLKPAGTFQAWGQRDGRGKPLNLGILYMDSESNRRWVLRVDDSSQLAGIDSMFVTVEPHGGSPKPTGKPFLYALLRKEANHP